MRWISRLNKPSCRIASGPGRHDAEVFTADKHVRDAFERRKFLRRLTAPEIVLPTIEVVHVKILQLGRNRRAKRPERRAGLNIEAEVELLTKRGFVLDQNHVTDQINTTSFSFRLRSVFAREAKCFSTCRCVANGFFSA